MARLLEDREVAERILRHIDAGTTDEGEGVWREPVSHYLSEERLHAEQRVLRRLPSPFCPSLALPEVGSFVARDAAGTPLLAVRGADRRVRVFRNACRHRGTQVAEGTGCSAAFRCRYHGWTYGLDGSLRQVPHEHGFPGLDRERHGLVSVTAEERHGLVWVTQEPGGRGRGPEEEQMAAAGASASPPARQAAVAEESLDVVPELLAKDQRLFAAREFLVPANWKVLMEGFLEGYHIRATHPQSFYPFGFDNLNLVETFGPHSRVTFPFQRIRKLAALPPEERRVAGALTYVYQLFPNAVVVVLSHHTILTVLDPVSTRETRFLSWSLTNRPAEPGKEADGKAAAERDAAFVNQTGGAEDIAVACSIQKGIESGANDEFLFGRFEAALAHFHRNLDAALATPR
ncbi:MAG TPA: SRPBCC family protein [Myxococcota bacterium]|nr:SRPBCC family protein [Myxococcota bacterium]